MAPAALTTTEVADELDTDPKTLRKFLRSHLPKETLPGQGKRYSFTTKDVPGLKKAFAAWAEGKAKKADDDDAEPAADKAPAKSKGKKSKKAAPAPAEEDLDEELDEPTAEDLDDIEDLDLGDDE